ncbi:MAG: hypothetical protein ACOYYS_17865 [Chloroflexota bacterium]
MKNPSRAADLERLPPEALAESIVQFVKHCIELSSNQQMYSSDIRQRFD